MSSEHQEKRTTTQSQTHKCEGEKKKRFNVLEEMESLKDDMMQDQPQSYNTDLSKELKIPDLYIDKMLQSAFGSIKTPDKNKLSEIQKTALVQQFEAKIKVLDAFEKTSTSVIDELRSVLALQKNEANPAVEPSTIFNYYMTAFFKTLHEFLDFHQRKSKTFIADQIMKNIMLGTLLSGKDVNDPRRVEEMRKKFEKMGDLSVDEIRKKQEVQNNNKDAVEKMISEILDIKEDLEEINDMFKGTGKREKPKGDFIQ